jgi:hypothetical protein
MKWLHNLLKGASLAGALFVFQACYGVPQAAPYVDDETDSLTVSLSDPDEELTGETVQVEPVENDLQQLQ